jgi:Na+/melibiose symporter-like transporter
VTIAKALIAVVVSAVGALVTALGTSPQQSFSTLSTTQWLVAVGSVLGSGGVVWFVENGPAHAYIKTVVAFLSAGIASIVVALGDGIISQAEWLTAFGAAVVATGLVFQIKNTPATP